MTSSLFVDWGGDLPTDLRLPTRPKQGKPGAIAPVNVRTAPDQDKLPPVVHRPASLIGWEKIRE